MQVFDLAILAKLVVYRLLVGLLVDVGYYNDPALNGAHGGRFAVGLHVVDFCLGGHGRDGLVNVDVDIHFYVSHGRVWSYFACLVRVLFGGGWVATEKLEETW